MKEVKMNKTKRKHLIVISIIAFFIICGISVSQFSRGGISVNDIIFDILLSDMRDSMSASMDDDYWVAVNNPEWVGTELFKNSSDTNSYIEMSIHRDYGIPRFGIPTDNNGNVLDTVWYITDCKPFDGTANWFDYTDTSITVYWRETPFRVLVIDILTGDTVLQEVHKGQPASMFADAPQTSFEFYDSVDASGNLHNPSSAWVVSNPASAQPFRRVDNLGTTINFANLPNGSYFIVTIDVNRNVLIETRTTRRK